MVTSALRYAARRLGGGGRALQRPHRSYAATADDVQGGLRTVWPTSCRRPKSSTSCGAATSSSAEHARPKSSAETLAQKSKEYYLASIQQKEIQSKQEELFQLIAKMDRELPRQCSKDNLQLLMHLSVRVQPKPDDSQWRFYRRAFTFNHCILYGWMAFLGYLAVLPSPRTRDV